MASLLRPAGTESVEVWKSRNDSSRHGRGPAVVELPRHMVSLMMVVSVWFVVDVAGTEAGQGYKQKRLSQNV